MVLVAIPFIADSVGIVMVWNRTPSEQQYHNRPLYSPIRLPKQHIFGLLPGRPVDVPTKRNAKLPAEDKNMPHWSRTRRIRLDARTANHYATASLGVLFNVGWEWREEVIDRQYTLLSNVVRNEQLLFVQNTPVFASDGETRFACLAWSGAKCN